MIYITGDKHADFRDVLYFCYTDNTTLDDILIVLGDAGINYFANEKDVPLKESLKRLCPITLFAYMEIMKKDLKILNHIKLKLFIKD